MNTTLASILAFLLSGAMVGLLGIKVVPWLHKLKFGQTILDIGPSWHKQKQGTPTMGGIMMIGTAVVVFAVLAIVDAICGGDLLSAGGNVYGVSYAQKVKILAGFIMALGFGLIGFLDDYIKVKKKQNEGLTVLQKTLLQVILCASYIATMVLSHNTYMFIPFAGRWDYGGSIVLYSIFTFIVMYAAVNAVNFTDGIDGLCSSVTLVAGGGFVAVAYLMDYYGVAMWACILMGVCAGFLVWNHHPAKVFMGDTGSMFLGGTVVGLAYALDCPLILLPIGIVYVAEGASDVIQILYFKVTKKIAQRKDPEATGKRLFKMAPIHHHFEKCGWSEEKICVVFSVTGLIGAAIAVLLVAFGQ